MSRSVFHLVQGERDRVGDLPFRYFFHQTRQVHLVAVIVCLVILPASRLRLHSSVSFQLCILSLDMVWGVFCFLICLGATMSLLSNPSSLFLCSFHLRISYAWPAVTAHGNLHGSSTKSWHCHIKPSEISFVGLREDL